MLKPLALAALIAMASLQTAQAFFTGPAPMIAVPGPMPAPGSFCAPLQPCPDVLVTRGRN